MMTRRLGVSIALSIVSAVALASAADALCSGGTMLRVSGQPGIIIDQSLPGPDYTKDCVASAVDDTVAVTAQGAAPSAGSYCAQASGGFQGTSPLAAAPCDDGMATGEWRFMDGMVLLSLESTTQHADADNWTLKLHGEPMPPEECAVVIPTAETSGKNGELPVDVLSAIVCEDGDEKVGSVRICNDNGPAFVAEAENMSTVLKRFREVTHMGIDFLCQNARMRGEGGGPIIIDLCFPLNDDGTATVEPYDEEPVVRLPLNNLPPCGGRNMAPTMTEWGLVSLSVGLLAVGTLFLRRRERGTPALRRL
jgi:hypothetical protein